MTRSNILVERVKIHDVGAENVAARVAGALKNGGTKTMGFWLGVGVGLVCGVVVGFVYTLLFFRVILGK